MNHHENFWTGFIGSLYGAFMGILQITPIDPIWLVLIKTAGLAAMGGIASVAGKDLYKYFKNKINGRRKIRN